MVNCTLTACRTEGEREREKESRVLFLRRRRRPDAVENKRNLVLALPFVTVRRTEKNIFSYRRVSIAADDANEQRENERNVRVTRQTQKCNIVVETLSGDFRTPFIVRRRCGKLDR